MRVGAVVLIIWLIIGVIAAAQRNYFSDTGSASCAKASDALITVLAGPLNYVGVNPRVHCTVPQPAR